MLYCPSCSYRDNLRTATRLMVHKVIVMCNNKERRLFIKRRRLRMIDDLCEENCQTLPRYCHGDDHKDSEWWPCNGTYIHRYPPQVSSFAWWRRGQSRH